MRDSQNFQKEVTGDSNTNYLNPSNDPNIFWVSFQEAMQYFVSLNVCRAINMHETRIRGKFLRIQDIEDSTIEQVMSKWYYTVDITQSTNVFIGIHQEDERKYGILTRRPYIDIGMAVMRKTVEGLHLIDIRDFQQGRQSELELTLEPGSYIILPRTTGCLMKPPEIKSQEEIDNGDLLERKKNKNSTQSSFQLSPLLQITLEDIFNKYDMLMTGVMGFQELKSFTELIG